MDKLFRFVNNVVEVAFILFIDVVWPLTSPNNVVEVAFKLLIDNIEFVDKLFKLVVVPYTDKSGLLMTVEL